jgi:hypothetical protein
MSEQAMFFGQWILPVICLYAGIRLERWRWQRNADQIQRIESSGGLYKVEHAEWTGDDDYRGGDGATT